jgi:hypothetical protein
VIFLFPLITLIISLWVYLDSQKRGYSVTKGLMWAVLVFMMMIVFLPLYLYTSRRKGIRKPEEAESAPIPTAPNCFYCGKPYNGDPRTCPNCGQNLRLG